ncbi:hypothetical protein LTR36_003561 [Oleoguttula mirabilis]|uniref:BZIP domain-containing protein n=1 Tax=Oleoguttula mirabilis TaxID=1507867 RepID=A0AAV9JJ23_9PEZI|nr:hypothetical protein LTR36_003561 [Oleoguttula mirabilis]
MTGRPAVKTEQFDMDSLFDFNQGTALPSPATASSSRVGALSPFDKHEERQHFNGPSHDYHQYKQQVGLPVGSMANMPMAQPQMFDGYSSGIGDMGFDGGFAGWNSGIDMDSEMSVDFNNPQSAMPAMFFPPQTESVAENFLNPNTMGGQEEPISSVGRLWPGMHSQQAQQAAMQKAAQAQAVQQRQIKLQSQQAHYRQVGNGSHSQVPSSASSQSGHANGKRAAHASEAHVEESISRLLNQMRQNSNVSDMDGGDSPGDILPHIARMKKDEEEMDEDERLLASDEGKKLSSKERRQLRNKVSARAFRSRRKEYIGQLEGEVAMKVQEANGLRTENTALLQENDRYRGLIETLLRHPAFTPFINDIAQDPSVLGMPQQQARVQPQQQQQQQPPVSRPTPQPQQQQHPDTKPEYMNFDASQLQVPSQQQQQPDQQQIGLAMIPEENFSKLNINGYRPAMMNFNSFQSVNAYAVTDVPRLDPVNLLAASSVRLPASATSTTASCSTTDYSAAAYSYSSDMTVLLAKLDGTASRMRCI